MNLYKIRNGFCGKYLPNKETLNAYIESRKDQMPQGNPEPSIAEREYLYDALEQDYSSDMMVYESVDWVESMKNTNLFEMNTRIYDLLIELLSKGDSIKNVNILDDSKSGVSISYIYIPEQKSIFLVIPFLRKDRQSVDRLNDKFLNLMTQTGSTNEAILKNSRRSYPSYILADEQMWRSIQKNDVGNIALSPEESPILEHVTAKTSDKLFPLFINGRPGSGKSTILQYLFASYLCMYLRTEGEARLPYPPLYLTYSEKLLDSAKKSIADILKCNSSIALHNVDLFSGSSFEIQGKCYGEFCGSDDPVDGRKVDEESYRNHWRVSGYRRCPAYQRVGSSCLQP